MNEYVSVIEVLKDVSLWNSLCLSHADLRGANLRDADLGGANLSGANLSDANLYRANLSGAYLSDADLHRANLSGADLSGADLRYANLHDANLSGADLSDANLHRANLSGADLHHADLSGANLRYANLHDANLHDANLHDANLHDADLIGANLRDTNLRGANLRGADLSQTQGIPTAKEFLSQFSTDSQGVLVYRAYGYYDKPSTWNLKKGGFLTETPNHDKCSECGCGVSFATKDWIKREFQKTQEVWVCRIYWEDLADVVVPYNTDGKARCARLQLLRKEEV